MLLPDCRMLPLLLLLLWQQHSSLALQCIPWLTQQLNYLLCAVPRGSLAQTTSLSALQGHNDTHTLLLGHGGDLPEGCAAWGGRGRDPVGHAVTQEWVANAGGSPLPQHRRLHVACEFVVVAPGQREEGTIVNTGSHTQHVYAIYKVWLKKS